MPWLSAVLSKDVSSLSSTAPANFSLDVQRAVLRETKRAWSLAEQVRSRLNELLSEFLVTSSLGQQLEIVSSAKKLVDQAVSAFVGEAAAEENLSSLIPDVRTNLAAEVILEAGHYIAVMEENLRTDEGREPPARSQMDRTDGEAKAVSQGFQSAEEVRQVFAYFKTQIERAAAEQPKAKSPRRQRLSAERKESAPKDVPAPSRIPYTPLFAAALSMVVAAVLVVMYAPSWLWSRILKSIPRRWRPAEKRRAIDEELLFSAPKKDKGGKKKRGVGGKAPLSPLISLIRDETAAAEHEPPDSDVLPESEYPAMTVDRPPESQPEPAVAPVEATTGELDLSAFSMDEQFESAGEWISASSSKPSRLKRALSNSTETHPRPQQTKKQIIQASQKPSRAKVSDTTRVEKLVQPKASKKLAPTKQGSIDKKQDEAVSAERPPASSSGIIQEKSGTEHPRTPSPSDVRELQSPVKGPFDHINVKWMPPPIGTTTNTRIIPDEEISDCSESGCSQSSPNEVSHDMEQVTMPQQPYPVMIPVPVYYVPAPMNFNQMHDQQGHMMPLPYMPQFEYYHGMHLPPQPMPDHLGLLAAVRAQIEYYFSTENLCRDMYLRGMMDHDGYVKLAEICKFNRIRSFGAPPLMILEAVSSSNVVSLLESPAVRAAKGSYESLSRLQEWDILESKIRPTVNPEVWPKRKGEAAQRIIVDQ